MKIRVKLILSFLGISLFIILIGVLTIFFHEKMIRNYVHNVISEAERDFSNFLELDTKIISSALDVFLRDEVYKSLFMAENREKLYENTFPLFQELRTKYGITHLNYILPDGRCLCRMSDKSIFMDKIDRNTFKLAVETKQMVSGLELGKTGFVLRVIVAQYYKDKDLIGYIEFGEEIDHLLNVLKADTHNQFMLIAFKNHLNMENYYSTRKSLGLRNNWDDFKDFVIVRDTIGENSERRKEFLSEELLKDISNKSDSENVLLCNTVFNDHNYESKMFAVSYITLKDVKGFDIGAVISFIDVTNPVGVSKKIKYGISLIALILLAGSLCIGYYVSRSISRPVMRLKMAVLEIAEGKLDAEIMIDSRDEIGELGLAFRKMKDDLSYSWKKIEAFNKDLEKKVEERTLALDMDHKRSEKALNESSNKLNAIVRGSPLPQFVIDRNHVVTNWNEALENYSGIKAKDIIGTNQHWRAFYSEQCQCLADIIVDNNNDDIIYNLYSGKIKKSELLEDAYTGTDFFPYMDRRRGKWLDFTAKAIKNSEGIIIGAVETLVDFTERKEAQERLNILIDEYKAQEDIFKIMIEQFEKVYSELAETQVASEKVSKEIEKNQVKFRTLIDSLSSGVVIYESVNNGKDFLIRDINKGTEIIDNVKKKEVINKSVTEVFPGAKEFGLFSVFQEVLKTGKPCSIPAKIYKDNRRVGWRENYVFKLPTGEIVSVYSDVSEQKRMEDWLRQNEKLTSLGRLVAGFAHEVNTPIGIAVTMSSSFQMLSEKVRLMLEKGDADEEELNSVLETIVDTSNLTVSALQRASKLISSFKRMSIDQSSEEARLYNFRETVNDVLNSLYNKFKNTKIQVIVQGSDTLNVFGEPGFIDQLLTNFLLNSYIHGFENGKMPGKIHIDYNLHQDGILSLTYSDNGKGMNEEDVDKVFEPFFTTRRHEGGSGLGMYICYNLVVVRLKGTISFKSSPRNGISVHITFPVKTSIPESE